MSARVSTSRRAQDGAGSAAEAGAVRAERRSRARRARLVGGSLAVLALALFTVHLTTGTFVVPVGDVLRILTGEQLPGATFVVWDLRLPRALTGLAVGAALAMSGSIFQTLVRNPLASPDVIGITAGASAAAVTAIALLGVNAALVAPIAFCGALTAALVIYGLAWRGGVSPYRLVLVGIGMAAILNAVVAYAMTRAQITDAADALVWITGSLNLSTWSRLPGLVLPMLVLVPLALRLGVPLRGLQLGDETATGLGVRTETTKLALVVVGVALAAVAVAAAGPVASVALVSGPIARRLCRSPGLLLVPAALVGACVVLGADLVAAQLLTARMPVGVVTGVLGAPFLLWLLMRSNRTGKAG